jgi:hypothetical protein
MFDWTPADFLSNLATLHRQYFPIFFILMWVGITSLLGLVSGWYSLMRQYPDQPEEPLLKLPWQSGSMGRSVSFGGVLTLSACPSGLRAGMLRIFGIFCHDFFVPWNEITVTRKTRFFFPVAELKFGTPATGRLTIAARIADQLVGAAGQRWAEPGPHVEETRGDIFRRLAKTWLARTGFVALFFIIASRLPPSNGQGLPVAIAILFPATVFGFAFLIQYFIQTKKFR